MKYKTTEDTNNILLAQYIKYRSYFVSEKAYLLTTDSLVAGIAKMQEEGIPRNKAIHALSARQKLFEVNKYLIDGELDTFLLHILVATSFFSGIAQSIPPNLTSVSLIL